MTEDEKAAEVLVLLTVIRPCPQCGVELSEIFYGIGTYWWRCHNTYCPEVRDFDEHGVSLD